MPQRRLPCSPVAPATRNVQPGDRELLWPRGFAWQRRRGRLLDDTVDRREIAQQHAVPRRLDRMDRREQRERDPDRALEQAV
jgi:hypothetical protein